MNTNIENNLDEKCCSICTHLSLQNTNNKSIYKIICVMLDDTPIPNKNCKYFELQHSNIHNNL